MDYGLVRVLNAAEFLKVGRLHLCTHLIQSPSRFWSRERATGKSLKKDFCRGESVERDRKRVRKHVVCKKEDEEEEAEEGGRGEENRAEDTNWTSKDSLMVSAAAAIARSW